MADGLVDTNVFIHALATDAHSDECRRFLALVERGEIEVRLEMAVLHELSYMLRRFLQQMTREDIGNYLIMILSWPGIEAEKILLVDTGNRWKGADRLGFVDAYLIECASRQNLRVYTKNVRELRGQGADVPDPLLSSQA